MKLLLLAGISVGTAAAAWLSYTSFLKKPEIDNSIVLLRDETDSTENRLDAKTLLSYTDLDCDHWQSINFSFSSITDYDYNETSEVSLPSKLFILSNPQERDEEIATFTKNLQSGIDSFSLQKNGRKESHIYTTVVRKLHELAQTPAANKVLILQSNLQENNAGTFNMYDSTNTFLLKKFPDSIQHRLLRLATPHNLTGIQIHLIHKPISQTDNVRFAQMAEIMKKIFTDAGATVFISANLPKKKSCQITLQISVKF